MLDPGGGVRAGEVLVEEPRRLRLMPGELVAIPICHVRGGVPDVVADPFKAEPRVKHQRQNVWRHE